MFTSGQVQNGILYNEGCSEAQTLGLVRIELFPDLHLALGQLAKILCTISKCCRGMTRVIHRPFVDYMNEVNFSCSSTYLP